MTVSFDRARFQALAEVEQKHFWFVSRARLIVWALQKHFPRARSVLEVGCGTGNILAALQAAGIWRVAGSEALAEGLAFAARRAPGAELVQADARALAFREEFDVVGAFDVIEHIRDDEAALAAMYAACRPGGGIMITVPQHAWLWSGRDVFAGHVRRYEREELARKLSAAGFVRTWSTSFTTLLLPLMVWSRRRRAQVRSAELQVGAAANCALATVMALERCLIRCGLRPPIGGSLLAVAHKP